jgi:hypothetical protein
MNTRGRKFAVAAIAALGALGAGGCGGDPEAKGQHEIWFMGSVYDGASGAVLTGYEITLVYAQHRVRGTVDAAGRYVVGPLPAWNDYGIEIGAAYYRAFSSYNAGISPPPPPVSGTGSASTADVYQANTTQTKNFDAYLFPDSLTAPTTTISIVQSGPMPMPASGSIRLQPSSQPSIQGQSSGVPAQIWTNDQDILAAVITESFSGGNFSLDAGRLVYGVTYQITIFNVEGFQPGMGTIRGGLEVGASITIAPQGVSPVQIIANNASSCMINAMPTDTTAAQITLTFNQPVEDGTTTAGGGGEILDNGLVIQSTLGSTLATNTSSAVQERGASYTISDNTLTLSWNPAIGLATKVSGDLITVLQYSGLSSIYVQPIGRPTQRAALSTLLNGSTSLLCQ